MLDSWSLKQSRRPCFIEEQSIAINMKILAFSLPVLALCCTSANAADWRVVGAVDTKIGTTEIELDRSSIVEYPSYRQFWARTSFPTQTFKNKSYSSSVMLVEMWCGIRQWKIVSIKAYEKVRGRGELVLDNTRGSASVPVEPDSVGEVLHARGCE